MQEDKARRVVSDLRERGIDARIAYAGVYQFGIRIPLDGGREAVWDTDGSAAIEAQVMRNGVLVGFVPVIEGSADFDDSQVVDAIARADYAQPIGSLKTATPAARPPLPRAGGVFQRFLDGFRYR